MIIDYQSEAYASFPEFKGGKKELLAKMFFDGKVRIMDGLLVPGASIGEHTHTTNCEVIFVIAGQGTIIEDGEAHPIAAGQMTYCEKMHSHSLVNSGNEDLHFYAVVPNID